MDADQPTFEHRVRAASDDDLCDGRVVWSPSKSIWFSGMALLGVIGGAATFTWMAFATFLGTTAFVLLFGHSIGMHRKLIHGSFECPKWLEHGLVYVGTLVGISGPVGLLRVHDMRDYAQRRVDCHDYFAHRRSALTDFWWQVHCELALSRPPEVRIEPRIAQNAFYRFLERTWMLQQLPWALLAFAWGGWAMVCWGIGARVTACILGHWGIGYLAHRRGERSFEVVGAAVQGHNVRFCALLTMGESWHNNHHAFPGSAKLGLRRGEADPGWWVLKGLERAGLAWRLRTPDDLPTRNELRVLHLP